MGKQESKYNGRSHSTWKARMTGRRFEKQQRLTRENDPHLYASPRPHQAASAFKHAATANRLHSLARDGGRPRKGFAVAAYPRLDARSRPARASKSQLLPCSLTRPSGRTVT